MGEPKIYTAKEADALRAAATPGPWCFERGSASLVEVGDAVVTHPAGMESDAALVAAAPDLAASVAHHARRADGAERQRDHLAAMLVRRTRDSHRWQFMAAGAPNPDAEVLSTWWRDSADRDALVQMLGADVVERAEVSRG